MSGTGYYTYAALFDQVVADATVDDATYGAVSGGADVANLYDSAAHDLFKAIGNEASFDIGNNGALDLLARGFGRVRAYSTAGGSDQKDEQAHAFSLIYGGGTWTP